MIGVFDGVLYTLKLALYLLDFANLPVLRLIWKCLKRSHLCLMRLETIPYNKTTLQCPSRPNIGTLSMPEPQMILGTLFLRHRRAVPLITNLDHRTSSFPRHRKGNRMGHLLRTRKPCSLGEPHQIFPSSLYAPLIQTTSLSQYRQL